MRHARIIVLTLVTTFLAACGDDGGSAPSATTTDGSTNLSTASGPTSTPTASTATPTTSSSTSTPTASSTADAIEAAQWAENVTITVESDSFTFVSDGLPNHDRDEQYLVPVGGAPGAVPESLDDVMAMDDPTRAQDYSFTIPIQPTFTDDTTATSGGSIGVIISGAVLFNPYEGDGTTVAVANNLTDANGVSFIDACNGHPGPGGAYHYHAEPTCITDTLDPAGEHSRIVGVAFDGFPIYGSQGVDGTVPTDLDECSGHVGPTPEVPEGRYHYHLLTEAPYSVPCFHGVVDATQFGHARHG